MKIYVDYDKNGDAVTAFNYDNEMQTFLERCKEHQESDKNMLVSYCTELGIQMVRILILRKLVLCTDVVFHYKGHYLNPDKNANFETWPEGFCDFTLNVLQELIDMQMDNWKTEFFPSTSTEK